MLNFNSFKVKVLCAAFFGQKENYRVTKQKLNTHRIVGTLLLKIFVRNICSYILPKNGYFNLVRAFANNFTNLNSFISYLQIIFLSERINLSKWNCSKRCFQKVQFIEKKFHLKLNIKTTFDQLNFDTSSSFSTKHIKINIIFSFFCKWRKEKSAIKIESCFIALLEVGSGGG